MEQARNVIDWDHYFINIADEVATRSKDPSTQVGAVIVDKNHRPVSFGYNGFL
jgi:dCMP deaminase